MAPSIGIFRDGGCHELVVLASVIMHGDLFEAAGDTSPAVDFFFRQL